MKKQIKSLLLVALLTCTTLPAWSQASTQGKEFWVSSTIACSPDKKNPVPYIAISAEKACTVNIQGGIGNAINITQQVAAGSWNEFGNSNRTYNTLPTAGIINVQMDASKWYPTTMTDANNVSSLAGQKNMYGLHITATEAVSVYVILATPNSMDASNILPITALGSEYYTQDYSSTVKSDFPNAVGLNTILGTEDGTQIDITPNGNTFDGHQSGQQYTITLNKGQTYYLVTEKGKQLTGTHIKAQNGRKIAIFCGVPITNIPTNIAARDCLFEQPMPIEYWGTQFIVTRSLKKNGNLIGITATQNGTEIKVDGFSQTNINEGETYYIMLQGAGDPNAKNPGTGPIDLVITADAAFIETSCPSAVYSYDTGNSYKGNGTDEIDNGKGDPSSIWVSPIQQKIGKITFGTCYTGKTKDHFLNVVTETATCQNTTLHAIFGATQIDKTSSLQWIPVPGNTKYSYARAQIGDASTEQYSVFRLENPKGFIAYIYGNGDDESYAYSAGSAAVERGVNVDGETFTDGYRSDTKFCLNTDLTFDSKVGTTDEITRVDWDFGDGITEYQGLPEFTHRYTSPGWYDVTANLYGHQVCTDESDVPLGSVHFTFRVVRPDTVYRTPSHICIPVDSIYNGKKLTAYEVDSMLSKGGTTIEQDGCADTVFITPVSFGLDVYEYPDTIVHEDQAVGYNGKTYYTSQEVIDTINPPANSKKCTIYRKYYVHVISCVKITVTNDSAKQQICPTEFLEIEYTKNGGDIKSARFVIPGVVDEEVDLSNEDSPTPHQLSLPTAEITTPGIYKGKLIVEDAYDKCENKEFPLDITVKYPNDIFLYKFNNVLAVYKKGYGGNDNYDFKNYEWHVLRNGQDSLLSAGENESVLYLGEGNTFEIGDQVYVVLTDMRGVAIPSCSQTITKVDDYTIPDPEQAPARKMLQQNRFVILKGDKTYDIYGQKMR